MQNETTLRRSAAYWIAFTVGILAALGGITHSVGEILQGSTRPDGIVINSWASGPIYDALGGDPGMTVVPNFLVTGILGVIVTVGMIVWCAGFLTRRRGGLVLILLSVAMLLFGGGFAPPVMGILAGVAGTGIGASYPRWGKSLRGGMREFLAGAWPYLFALTAALGVFLVFGSLIAAYVFRISDGDVFAISFLASVPLIIVTTISGVAYDLERAGEKRLAMA